MPRTPSHAPKRKKDDPGQTARFVETGKTVGGDDNPEALDKAFMKVARRKHRKTS
jgi:hypothetical protein